jgi:tRNA pseudouridine38-40 synthase
MTTYRLDLAYDGGRFRGWAAQPGQRPVQGELEDALERVLGERVGLTVAGRTDAGVHALAQVASFAVSREPPPELSRALNALTGPDLAVLGLRAAPGFDARRAARSRRYRYRVETAPPPSPFERGRALHWPHRLDREALDACAGLLAGSHDFTAFTPTETERVRFVRNGLGAGWSAARQGLLACGVEADAFLRNMVRVLVGTMLEVGGGRRGLGCFERLLAGAPRRDAGPTASPHGLYLLTVRY